MRSCIWHLKYWIMHCYLHREHRLREHLRMPGSEKTLWDRMTTEFTSRSFLSLRRMTNVEQKEAFVKVIEDTLKDIVENGMDKKALEAGINYNEFRYREADFGGYPKGLMYGLQIFDSWLYDDNAAFLLLETQDAMDELYKRQREAILSS